MRSFMSKRDEKLFLYDIKDATEAILSYTASMDLDLFKNDRKTYSAVIREFEIIGEATKHLSNETINLYTQVHWRDMQDFRNILIHEYFGVDFEIVWNTIFEDLPQLLETIKKIIEDQNEK